jgi:glycosyltransferase involved in cell wall biosynthesis
MSKYNFELVDHYFAHCERRVALKSKICITTSNYLTDKLKKINPNTYEIPLGASISADQDVKFFTKQSKVKIVVGQVGFLSKRQVPVALLNRIIDCDKFQVVLIGPVEKSFLRKLNRNVNVRMVGSLTGQALYYELNHIDIGLAIYNLKKINPGTTSNKLWQYLSLGKPVVVSNLPNIRNMTFPPKSIYILNNEDEILSKIIQASNENSDELIRMRLEFARKNTWDIRVAKFLEIISQLGAKT